MAEPRRKSYRVLAVSLVLPEDEDIAQLVDSLPRGTVSPWIKQAIREAICAIEMDAQQVKEG